MYSLKGWSVRVRCHRCHREVVLLLNRFICRDDRRLLGDVLKLLRCQVCRSKPSKAMLTNARDPTQARTFMNRDPKKGPMQIMLWADRNT